METRNVKCGDGFSGHMRDWKRRINTGRFEISKYEQLNWRGKLFKSLVITVRYAMLPKEGVVDIEEE